MIRNSKYDPRTIFYSTIMYVVALAFANRYYQVLMILPLICIFQLRLFSINPKRLKNIFKYSALLLLSMICINYFLIGREIGHTILLVTRLVTIILISTAMVSKMEIREIGFVLEKTLFPLKIFRVPVESISIVTALAFKFIPMLDEEGKRIVMAQKARGIDYKLMGIKEKVSNMVGAM